MRRILVLVTVVLPAISGVAVAWPEAPLLSGASCKEGYAVEVVPETASPIVGQSFDVVGRVVEGSFGVPIANLVIYQDSESPVMEPTEPEPIQINNGSASAGYTFTWTVQAVRLGSVQFVFGVAGEIWDPDCAEHRGCWYWIACTSTPVSATALEVVYLPLASRP